MNRSIVVRTQFEGLHCYADAPQDVAFLRNLHRHMFYVEAELEVFHDDRELEFIQVKRTLNEAVQSLKTHDASLSCEQMADIIIQHLVHKYGRRQIIVAVFEDNENGGKIYYGI